VVLLKNFILSILLVAAAPAVFADNEGSGPEVGQPAPKLYGRTLDDELYSLKKDTGKAKVINFFWVECHPCREEMPELARLEKEFKDVKFISVHTSLKKKAEEIESVAKFVKSLKGAPSHIVVTKNKDLGAEFNIIGLPHTMLLDKNNIVLMNITGYDKKDLKKLADELQRITKQ
jgi:thiol-disulfide isomerase/thioredoxin